MYRLKNIIFLSLFMLIFACNNLDISSGQADSFMKLIGSGNSEIGNDVKEFNSGFIILSTINFNNENKNNEIVLYQTDKYGNLLNSGVDTLSTKRGGDNEASKILLTDDGGFIVLGTVQDTANGNNAEIYIAKFTSSIVREWEQFINVDSDIQSNEKGSSIKKASSGYIIVGMTDIENEGSTDVNNDVFLVKVDDIGDVVWSKIHGGIYDDYASDIITINNGYLIVGSTNSFGQGKYDIMLIETNLTGGSPDFITYGSSENDYGQTVIKDDDGGYIIVGNVEEVAGNNSNVHIIKVESNIHNLIWRKDYGSTALNDQGYDIVKSNGAFIITGTKELSSGSASFFLKIIEVDSEEGSEYEREAEILVENTFGGYSQIIYSIEPTSDGKYIMTGSSGAEGNEMISLLKLNTEGEL